MREALRVMEQERFQDADIVFITDGVCDVSDALAAELQTAQAEKRCSVIGLLLDADNLEQAFSLEKFCERVYRVSEMTEDTIEQEMFSDLSA